mmetsp:Transcript_15639/g.26068  ORF Transcript_15639/g.26068 Transcript_15639/m.26068 type:complete len:104 (+) Transcript_15639:62-373(+)
MPMHVRLKRKNQTMFLHVDPADNFYQLKTRVGEIHGLEPEKIQILGPDKKKELLDLATISDQEIKNDDVLYLVFMKGAGGWEELQVDVLAPFGEEAPEGSTGS